MSKFLFFVKRLFCLPFIPTLLVTAISLALLICAFALSGLPMIVVYLSYAMSAYGMTIMVVYIVRTIRMTGGDWRQLPVAKWFLSRPFGQRLHTNPVFRTEVSLWCGITVNLLYVVVKLLFGLMYRSFWFTTVGIYYFLLLLMHAFLLHRLKQMTAGGDDTPEYRRYRLCGILLLSLMPVLGMIVFFMVWFDRGYEYPGMLIYVMAAYTFYTVTMAIVRIIRKRGRDNPIFAADRCVTVCAALVSVLSLTSAMLAQFGTAGDAAFRKTMTMATGIGVCAVIAVLAIYMIINSTCAIRKKRNIEENNE